LGCSVNQAALEITLNDFDGDKYTLPVIEKKPSVVFFWAFWCSGCNKEAPELVKLQGQYKDSIDIY
jgi:thiol-disulfide isomerase/thioredoxin